MDYTNLANNLFSTMMNQGKRQIISVNGIQEAKNFTLGRGENVIMRDSNEDIIYVKSCDDMGKCSLKIYSCLDITEQAISETNPNTELNGIKAELSELKNMIGDLVNGKHDVKRNERTGSSADKAVSAENK